jgi:hypothetical protein
MIIKYFDGQAAVTHPYNGTLLSDYPSGWNFTNCPREDNGEGPGDYVEIFANSEDTLRITYLSGAWSRWAGSYVTLCSNKSGPLWHPDYSVMYEDGSYNTFDYVLFNTQEQAQEYGLSQSPRELTGHTRYTIWLFDGYLYNRGGITLQIELIPADGSDGGGTQSPCDDMNPAHIIRECLTDPDWGMGYAESDIDDTSFIAAADTLYDEGMGISILWDRENTLEAFVQDIVRHIDAALYVDRSTGKFVLKLIRDDYDPEAIITLGPSEIESVENYRRPAFGELINAVTVNYWSCETG